MSSCSLSTPEYPTLAAAGSRFDVKVEITNTDGAAQDFKLRLLEGVRIVGESPCFLIDGNSLKIATFEGVLMPNRTYTLRIIAIDCTSLRKTCQTAEFTVNLPALPERYASLDKDTYTRGETAVITYDAKGIESRLIICPFGIPAEGMSWDLRDSGTKTYTFTPTDRLGEWGVEIYNGGFGTGDTCTLVSGAPPPGRPFKVIADWFNNYRNWIGLGALFGGVADAFYTLDTWYLEVAAVITSILSWDAIKTEIDATYNIVTHAWSEVTGAISSAIDALPSWAKKTFDDAVDDFIEGFINRFNASGTLADRFITALGAKAGDTLLTILDTSWQMFDWLKDDVIKAFPIVTRKWSEVTGAVSSAIAALPDIVDHSWSEVTDLIPTWSDLKPSWMWTSLDNFKDKLVGYVSEKFELILDRVFKD